MDANEYLNKAVDICLNYEHKEKNGKGCDACPLKDYSCGNPHDKNEIPVVIDIVEKWVNEEKVKKYNQCEALTMAMMSIKERDDLNEKEKQAYSLTLSAMKSQIEEKICCSENKHFSPDAG